MSVIQLGNVAPIEAAVGLYHTHRIGGDVEHHHADTGRRLHRYDHEHIEIVRELNPLLSHTTILDVPDERTPDELLVDLDHLWPHHSKDTPGFVVAEDPEVQRAVEQFFGIKPPKGPVALYTNAGRDWVAQQVLGAAVAAATNQMKYVALTANSTNPAATDTTLTGEITTASGGLVRGAGTFAHTTAASSSTITKTHTANGSDSLPVTIAKEGLFNDPSAGSMGFETLLSVTATLSASGDALTTTWTINH